MYLISSVILTGFSLYLFIWVVSRPAVLRPFTAGAHGRHLFLNIAWPWVLAFRPLCEPFISWRTRARIARQLDMSGLGSVWQPAEFVALQIVVFIAIWVIVMACGHAFLAMSPGSAVFWACLSGCASAWWPRHVIITKGHRRQYQMLREFPFLLDITTLCVEAGLNLQGALQKAAHYGPPGPLREELRHTLADIRAGTSRLDALTKLAERTNLQALSNFVAAISQAEKMGSSLGPLLRAQSDQRRSEQFLRTEERALKAPVKMLFPMVLCIFPCTFLIIGFPVVIKVFTGAG